MNYIVLDLEWNQCPSGKEQENKELPFEIIEIGAIKLDEKLREVSRFHEIIAPTVYKSLHKITKELIVLTMSELMQGLPFTNVGEEFFKWCGEEGTYMFVTWGSMDLTELQRNCNYFKIDYNFPWPFEYYDLQKLYSRCYSDGKTRIALETAVTERNLEKDIPFHSAFADALYTSRVMREMDFSKVSKFTSIDTYRIPQTKKEEFIKDYGEYVKYVSRGFEDKDAIMKDDKLLVSICPECRKNIRKKIRWFTANSRTSYAVAICSEHGFVKDKIKIRKTDNGKCYAIKITKLATSNEVAEIKERQNIERIKRRKRRIKDKQNNQK